MIQIIKIEKISTAKICSLNPFMTEAVSKSMDWFPYDNGLRHDRVTVVVLKKSIFFRVMFSSISFCQMASELASKMNSFKDDWKVSRKNVKI